MEARKLGVNDCGEVGGCVQGGSRALQEAWGQPGVWLHLRLLPSVLVQVMGLGRFPAALKCCRSPQETRCGATNIWVLGALTQKKAALWAEAVPPLCPPNLNKPQLLHPYTVPSFQLSPLFPS